MLLGIFSIQRDKKPIIFAAGDKLHDLYSLTKVRLHILLSDDSYLKALRSFVMKYQVLFGFLRQYLAKFENVVYCKFWVRLLRFIETE